MSDTRPVEQRLTRRMVVSNIVMLFSGSAISQGLTALVLLLIARGVGPVHYGEYASSIVLATLLSMLFSLGLDTWLLREGGSRPAEIGGLAGSVLSVKIGLGALWLAALFAFAGFLPSTSFTASVLRLAAVIILLDSLLTTFQAIFKATLRNQITSALVVGSDLSWMIATLAYYLQGGREIGVYMQIRVLVLAFSVLVGGLVFFRCFQPRIRSAVLVRIRNEFLPYFISDLLLLALLRVDVLIVTLTLGKQAVGLYSPAVSIVSAMYVIPIAVHGVMLPVLSRLFVEDASRAWRMAYRVIGVQAAIGGFATFGLFILSPILVQLLGAAYATSLDVLKILSFNLLFRGISLAMVSILIANNRQSQRMVVQFAAVLVNVLLNLAVVYWAGIKGVAVVYVVAEIFLAGGYTLLVIKFKQNSRLYHA